MAAYPTTEDALKIDAQAGAMMREGTKLPSMYDQKIQRDGAIMAQGVAGLASMAGQPVDLNQGLHMLPDSGRRPIRGRSGEMQILAGANYEGQNK